MDTLKKRQNACQTSCRTWSNERLLRQASGGSVTQKCRCLLLQKAFTGLASDGQDHFLAYPWPGNVRELANVIERAVVLGAGPQITLADLPPSLVGAPPLLASPAPTALSYHDATVAFQRTLLRQALAQAQGNHTAAARALGLQRTYFQRLLNSFGLR